MWSSELRRNWPLFHFFLSVLLSPFPSAHLAVILCLYYSGVFISKCKHTHTQWLVATTFHCQSAPTLGSGDCQWSALWVCASVSWAMDLNWTQLLWVWQTDNSQSLKLLCLAEQKCYQTGVLPPVDVSHWKPNQHYCELCYRCQEWLALSQSLQPNTRPSHYSSLCLQLVIFTGRLKFTSE